MAVTAGEFDVAMHHLDATLDELNVPKTDRDELVALIMPMLDDIIEVESPQTGTPLPDSYQAAPLCSDRPGPAGSCRVLMPASSRCSFMSRPSGWMLRHRGR
jgi:hypothetical protein